MTEKDLTTKVTFYGANDPQDKKKEEVEKTYITQMNEESYDSKEDTVDEDKPKSVSYRLNNARIRRDKHEKTARAKAL